KKKRQPVEPAGVLKTANPCLQGLDVLCLGAFGALADGELHFLAFNQGPEAGALDCAEVGEDIGTTFLRDESKTFGFVKPLYRSGCCRHDISCWRLMCRLSIYKALTSHLACRYYLHVACGFAPGELLRPTDVNGT